MRSIPAATATPTALPKTERPGQPPIPWARQRWLEDLLGNAAALARLPDRLDRTAVRTACADASRSPAQAVEAFLADELASRSDSGPLHAAAQAIVTDGIPQQMQAAGYPAEWVLDAINVVAACLACNGYFNRDPVVARSQQRSRPSAT